MPLRPGDRVSLSISPVIALGRFVNCKAHATLTRELGEDVEADLADMEATLVPLYRRALLAELGELNELQEIVGAPRDSVDWTSVEGLVDYCVKSIHGHSNEEEAGTKRRVGSKRSAGKSRPDSSAQGGQEGRKVRKVRKERRRE